MGTTFWVVLGGWNEMPMIDGRQRVCCYDESDEICTTVGKIDGASSGTSISYIPFDLFYTSPHGSAMGRYIYPDCSRFTPVRTHGISSTRTGGKAKMGELRRFPRPGARTQASIASYFVVEHPYQGTAVFVRARRHGIGTTCKSAQVSRTHATKPGVSNAGE